MTCRACGGTRLVLVFEMEPMPLAGAFATTRQAAIDAERYPLEWHRCRDCGLVNVAPSIPEATIFADYSYRASDVPALVRHHEAFAGWLNFQFPSTRTMLEIGGNDGVLLTRLPPEWHKVNVDPSDVAMTGDHRYLLVRQAWPTSVLPNTRWDLITSSNAFAHFDAIGEGLAAVRAALRPGGHFVMEVHDLDATLADGQWDTAYHEHRAEWSLPALSAAGSIHGLKLVHHERLPLHGGLLRAVFRPDAPRRPTRPPAPDFGPLCRKYAERRPLGATAAYGAAARATVYLNQVPEPVEVAYDDSPRRMGRYIPGTGLPIEAGNRLSLRPFSHDRVLITAWTQADDIRAAHPDFRGEWVTAW